MPQSTRKRVLPVSTSVQEPVTSPAAPRKVIFIFSILPTWRSMNLRTAEINARTTVSRLHGMRFHLQEVSHVQAYSRPDRRLRAVARHGQAGRLLCQGSRGPGHGLFCQAGIPDRLLWR